MLKFLRNIVSKDEQEQKNNNKQQLFSLIEKNIEQFKKAFDKSADLTIRPIKILNTKAAIITMEGMINKEMFC